MVASPGADGRGRPPAKAGLESMTRSLAASLGPHQIIVNHQITVNAVGPGNFTTETNQELVDNAEATGRDDRQLAGAVRGIGTNRPCARLGQLDDSACSRIQALASVVQIAASPAP